MLHHVTMLEHGRAKTKNTDWNRIPTTFQPAFLADDGLEGPCERSLAPMFPGISPGRCIIIYNSTNFSLPSVQSSGS